MSPTDFFIQCFWNCTSVSGSDAARVVEGASRCNWLINTCSVCQYCSLHVGQTLYLICLTNCTMPFILCAPNLFYNYLSTIPWNVASFAEDSKDPWDIVGGDRKLWPIIMWQTSCSCEKCHRISAVHKKQIAVQLLICEWVDYSTHALPKNGWCFIFQVSSTYGSSIFQNDMTCLCHSFVSEATDTTSSFTIHRGRLALVTQP